MGVHAGDQVSPDAQIAQLRSQVASLEQLLEVHEATTLEQATRLEREIREREELVRHLRAAQQLTEAAESRLNIVFSQAPAPIAVLRGSELVFELANDPYLRLIGNRQVIGKPVRVALPELAGQGVLELLEQVYARGEPFIGTEVPVMVDSGAGVAEQGFYNFVFQPLIEVDGAVSGVAVVAADVTSQVIARSRVELVNTQLQAQAETLETQREELEQQYEESQVLTEELQSANDELHNANQLAERSRLEADVANKAKSEFLANMSHELRTPLNAIGGYAELLTAGIRGPINDAQRTDLERIKRSQHHLLALINDILNFAKIEAGHVRMNPADISMNEALGKIEELVAPQLLQKQLRYEYRACETQDTVHVDADRLQQIMLNLLSNAVKFTPAGGEILVDCDIADDEVSIRVRDTGSGIPADKLEQIFEPFVQLDRTRSTGEAGTGLGLAISRDLARAMQGDLIAESTPEKGSVFTLKIPRVSGVACTQ